jgi:hypothetical protein
MEPDRIQEFRLIPPGCVLILVGCLIGAVLGAIVGSASTSPGDIAPEAVVLIFSMIGAGLGVAAALLGVSLWWLFHRLVRRRVHDESGQASHGRKSD